MKLNCNVIDDLLPLYLDGVCSAESRALVEEHLKECPACREKVASLRQDEEPAPVHLEEAKPVAELAHDLKRKVRQRRILLDVLAAVLLVLIVLGGVNLYVWYFYMQTVTLPVEEVAVIESGVDEDGMIYFDLDILPEDRATRGWTFSNEAEDGTVYFALKTSLNARESEQLWDTFSIKDSNSIPRWMYTDEQVDRVIYRDDAGNELVIYEKDAED